MTLLLFSYLDDDGQTQLASYDGPDIETCFDALSTLKKDGWQFKRVEMISDDQSRFSLPVEAFDGVGFSVPFRQLQQVWELLLYHNDIS